MCSVGGSARPTGDAAHTTQINHQTRHQQVHFFSLTGIRARLSLLKSLQVMQTIQNSCSLKTVSSTDAYLNLDDCILHYSPMCSLNFVHIVRIVRLTLRFILCNRFYVLLLHSICNSVRMTCLIKRLLILSFIFQ